MPVEPEHVRDLANAYRKMLDEGDSRFRARWLDEKVLLAIVVKSAGDQATWIGSRVPDGGALKGELDSLAEDLRKRDVVGYSLQSMMSWVQHQMITLVLAAVGFASWPAWLLIVPVLLGRWGAVVVLAGEKTGFLLIGLATVGGASSLLYIVFRLLHEGAEKVKTAQLSIGVAVIGSGPEALFRTHARPALERLRSQHGPVDQPALNTPVVPTLRTLAALGLTASCIFLVVSVLWFVDGVSQAWEEHNKLPCIPSVTTTC